MFKASKSLADRVAPNGPRRKLGPGSAMVAAASDFGGSDSGGSRSPDPKLATPVPPVPEPASKTMGASGAALSAGSRGRRTSAKEGSLGDTLMRARPSLILRNMGVSSVNVLRASLQEMQELRKQRWVLHPQSPFKMIWDVVSACIVLFYTWIIPFMLCFDWFVASPQLKTLMNCLDAWAILDIVLRFRTGIIQYGAVVMNPRAIRHAYVTSVWFPIDLASSIPFGYFIRDSNSESTRKTIKLIKYIKLPRLLRIGRFLKYVKGYKRYSSMTIALNAVVLASHVAGCLWVAILDPCTTPSGADSVFYCARGNEIRVYWIAFQHGVVSLLGVSSEHVEASQSFLSGGRHLKDGVIRDEVYLWSSAVSIIGAILAAVLFGTVVGLVQSFSRAENAFRKKMDQVSHEMDALCLPKHLRGRVNAYYDYLWLNNRAFSEELSLLQDQGMSLALREQIAIYLFKDYLLKIPFFQLASDSVLGMICMQLRQVIYMPGDFIIREGDIGKELFMIVKGVVRVMPPKDETAPHGSHIGSSGHANGTTTTTTTTTATRATNGHHHTDTSGDNNAAAEPKKILLGEGDFFGEIGVVMEVQRTRSVRAESIAELCILSRDGFHKIMVEFPVFATAMKRLIVKRVGEMWTQGDNKEQVDKMTALTDLKMKKAAQTYRNMDKLRVKTRALQSMYPRLSKLVKSSSTGEADGEDVGGAHTISRALMSVSYGEERHSTSGLATLSPIGESSESSSPSARLPNVDEQGAKPGATKEEEAAEAQSSPRSWQHHKAERNAQMHAVQLRLDQVEQSMEARLSELSSRMGQLLSHFEARHDPPGQ